MAPTFDDSPELVEGHDLPEAYNSSRQQPQEQVWSPPSSITPTHFTQPPVAYGETRTYGTAAAYSDAGKSSAAAGIARGETAQTTSPGSEKKAATVGGISLVLILSIIIALLSAAVIGLAAGTGVATNNYHNANSRLAVLSSSLAAAQATTRPTGTSSGTAPSTTPDFNNITSGCSDTPSQTNGTIYTSSFFGKPHFTIFCNQDTNNGPLLSLFATDFDACMDGCAAWNSYNSTTNGTCVAVSFIPLWRTLADAVVGGAPGDCYLKPGPTKNILKSPNIGTECHAALLLSS